MKKYFILDNIRYPMPGYVQLAPMANPNIEFYLTQAQFDNIDEARAGHFAFADFNPDKYAASLMKTSKRRPVVGAAQIFANNTPVTNQAV